MVEPRSFDLELSIVRTASPPEVVRHESWTDGRGRPCAWGCGSLEGGRIEVAGVGVYCFSSRSRIVEAHLARGLPISRARAAFDRVVRPLVLQTRGWQPVHASAVAQATGVVGLCGRSGAGKSTMARAWSRDRDLVFADDTLAMRSDQSVPQVLKLPMRPASRPAAGTIARLRAIVLLETKGPDPASLERLSPKAALTDLLPHAVCLDTTDRGLRRELFTRVLAVAETVPVFRLRYRQTSDSISALTGLLDERFGAY